MTTFSATFSAVAVSAAQDVFEIVAGAGCRVRIRDLKIGQYSDFGDAQAEILSVVIMRGHTTTGTGGTALTPVNLQPWSRAADCTVKVNNTTVAANGSPVTLVADTFNVAAGWSLRDCLSVWDAPKAVFQEGIWIEAGQRLVVRITAPADALTMNGTLVFEEHSYRVQ